MDWQNYYHVHLRSAEDAILQIPPHCRIILPNAMGEPVVLIEALVAQKAHFNHSEIVHMIGAGDCAYISEEMQPHFRHNSIYVGASTRKPVAAGLADFTPIYFSQIPHIVSQGRLKGDACLVTLSPPDAHGWCSLGVAVDYNKAAIAAAPLVIAQINRYMPRTHGDSFVHVSDVDYFVEGHIPIRQLPRPLLTEVEEKIGYHCASLVNDGDTLQLGIGSLPDAVLKFLAGKQHLGIHTEMFSDGVVELVESGVITNKKKTLHAGKLVASFLMGTQKLYDFVDDNPAVMMLPVEYVNDPYVIRQNDNMVSINSCVQVDLMGQVASESIGQRQISAIGGQVDFVRGASMAKNGRAIIAMPSQTKDGTSKIVPFLDHGAAVTTSRCDVQYIITEYGIADLRQKTLAERAHALIEIAHPNFHKDLIAEWETRFLRTYA